jgi:hypothetical protein
MGYGLKQRQQVIACHILNWIAVTNLLALFEESQARRVIGFADLVRMPN